MKPIYWLLAVLGFALLPVESWAGLGTPASTPERTAIPRRKVRAATGPVHAMRPARVRPDVPGADVPRWRKTLSQVSKWLGIGGWTILAVGLLCISLPFSFVFFILGFIISFLAVCAGVAVLVRGRGKLDKATRRRAIAGIISGGIAVVLVAAGFIVYNIISIVY